MNFRRIRNWLVVTGFIVFSPLASAGFTVYPIAASVEAEKSSLIRVYSKDTDPLYIKTYVKRIVKPGTPDEYEEVVPAWQANSLIVSPGKIIVPAGGNKAVRLTTITPPEKEVIYRVYFESVQPTKEDTVDSTNSTGKETFSSNVSLNIIYAALVRVLPVNKVVDVGASIINDEIVLTGTGTVRTAIKRVELCPTQQSSVECNSHEIKKNLYPEQQMHTSVKGITSKPWVLIYTAEDKSDKTESVISIKL